jgi:hypothetical protein
MGGWDLDRKQGSRVEFRVYSYQYRAQHAALARSKIWPPLLLLSCGEDEAWQCLREEWH